MRELSAAGRKFVEDNEGRKYVAYKDQAGVWTNGVGHTGPDVYPGQKVTDAQIDAWFAVDAREAEEAVTDAVTVPLSEEEFDAMVDFAYNIGAPAFKGSTLVRLLNQRKYDLVHDQLLQWINIHVNGELERDDGLVNRRLKEAALFEHGMVPTEVAALPVSNVVPTAPTQTKISTSPTIWAQGVGLVSAGWAWMSSLFNDPGQVADVAQTGADKVSGLLQYSEHFKPLFFGLTVVAIIFTILRATHKIGQGKT
jgi:lysozyme